MMDALKKAQAAKHTSAGEDFANGAGWLGDKIGSGLKSLGGGAKDALKLVAPDMEAWGNGLDDIGDIAEAAFTDKDFNDIAWDTSLSDLGNMALDASVLIPGVGLVSGTAGKAALRGAGRMALREVAAQNSAKAAAKAAGGGRLAGVGGALKRGLLGEVKDASGNAVTYGSKAAANGAGKAGPKSLTGKAAGEHFGVKGAKKGQKLIKRSDGIYNQRAGGAGIDALEGLSKRLGPGNNKALDIALGRRRGGVVGALTGAGKVPLGLRTGAVIARNNDLDILESLFGSDKAPQQDKYAGFDEQVPDVVVGTDGLYYYGGGGASVGNGGGLSLQELGSTLGVENLQDLAEYVSKR